MREEIKDIRCQPLILILSHTYTHIHIHIHIHTHTYIYPTIDIVGWRCVCERDERSLTDGCKGMVCMYIFAQRYVQSVYVVCVEWVTRDIRMYRQTHTHIHTHTHTHTLQLPHGFHQTIQPPTYLPTCICLTIHQLQNTTTTQRTNTHTHTHMYTEIQMWLRQQGNKQTVKTYLAIGECNNRLSNMAK
jgi:hypothetical protein